MDRVYILKQEETGGAYKWELQSHVQDSESKSSTYHVSCIYHVSKLRLSGLARSNQGSPDISLQTP